MDVPKLMLLCAYPPGSPGVGGLLLGEVADAWPQGRLCCFSLGKRAGVDEAFAALPTATGDGWPERGLSRSRARIARALTLPARVAAWSAQARRLVAEAVRFGKEQGVEKLCGVVDTLTCALVVRRVALGLGVPYFTVVWDPPEYHAHVRGLDRAATRWAMRGFARMQRGAQALGVASHNMAQDYGRAYGRPCVPLYHGIPRDLWQPAVPALSDPGRVTICCSGGLHGGAELGALMAALDTVDWRVGGREVRLRVMTPAELRLRSARPANVEFLGYRPQGEAILRLHESDAGYVPCWFDPAFRGVATLSFPGKIAATCAAGRPVFYHGPAYGSAVEFIQRHGIGACCHSPEPGPIVESLERFTSDQAGYAAATKRTLVVREQILSREGYLRAFAELADVEPDALAPSAGARAHKQP